MKLGFNFRTISICCSLALFTLYTSESHAQIEEKNEIMMLGFAHLSKINDLEPSGSIFTEKKQKEIQELVNNIKEFNPELILVEIDSEEQKENDSLFQLYNSDKRSLKDFEYGAGETYQIGFRTAKQLGLNGVTGVNYYESYSQSLLATGDHIEIFQKELENLQNTARPWNEDLINNNISLNDFIKMINTPEMLELTHHLFFNLPAYVKNGDFDKERLGDLEMSKIDKEYIGAEYISLFYNRNLKIYSNILNAQLKSGKKRVLLIMGQAHIGVLQNMLEHNQNFTVVPASKYL